MGSDYLMYTEEFVFFYGDRADFRIESEIDKGTGVTMILPKRMGD